MIVAGICAVLAVVVLVRSQRRPLGRLEPLATVPSMRRRYWPAAIVLAGVAVGSVTGQVGWVVSLAIVSTLLGWLFSSHQRDKRTQLHRKQTAQVASTLSMLLKSGTLPHEALRVAADEHELARRAAAAARLGADVPAALRDQAATQPGCEGLARIGAAWHASHVTGAPISSMVERVAADLRAQEQLAGVVKAELSAARMSSRIMAVLPLAAMGLGAAMGAHPWRFFAGSVLGDVALIVGAGLCAAGVIWTERLTRKVRA